MKTLILSSFLFLIAVQTQAQRPVNFINVRGDGSVTQEEWQAIYAQTDALPTAYGTYQDIWGEDKPRIYDWLAGQTNLLHIGRIARESGCETDKAFCYAIMPPLKMLSGARAYGGLTWSRCAGGGFAIGTAGHWSSHSTPRPRDYASAVVFMHEFAHGRLDCSHDDSAPNIMHSAVGRYVDSHRGILGFLHGTRTEMEQCDKMEERRLERRISRKRRRCRFLKRDERKRRARRCYRQLDILEATSYLQAAREGRISVFMPFE